MIQICLQDSISRDGLDTPTYMYHIDVCITSQIPKYLRAAKACEISNFDIHNLQQIIYQNPECPLKNNCTRHNQLIKKQPIVILSFFQG